LCDDLSFVGSLPGILARNRGGCSRVDSKGETANVTSDAFGAEYVPVVFNDAEHRQSVFSWARMPPDVLGQFRVVKVGVELNKVVARGKRASSLPQGRGTVGK
jgi:hypothetical protein